MPERVQDEAQRTFVPLPAAPARNGWCHDYGHCDPLQKTPNGHEQQTMDVGSDGALRTIVFEGGACPVRWEWGDCIGHHLQWFWFSLAVEGKPRETRYLSV